MPAPAPLDYDPDRLAAACRSLGLRLAVAFGSRVTGSPTPVEESDLDLAVLPTPGDAPASFLDYYRPLSEVFARYTLDLALLHRADPLFRHEVMRSGRLLFGDPDLFAAYRAFAYRDYVDSADLRTLEGALYRKKMAHLAALLDAPA